LRGAAWRTVRARPENPIDEHVETAQHVFRDLAIVAGKVEAVKKSVIRRAGSNCEEGDVATPYTETARDYSSVTAVIARPGDDTDAADWPLVREDRGSRPSGGLHEDALGNALLMGPAIQLRGLARCDERDVFEAPDVAPPSRRAS
jgi:hypothetical protein